MPDARAKVLDYEIELDELDRVSAEGAEPVELPPELAPEHLALAGLLRCTRASLVYHARRAGYAVDRLRGSAEAKVTRREQDSRYAFVDIVCRFAVTLEPRPGGEALASLLAKAERDCFVGASFTAAPAYEWTVE